QHGLTGRIDSIALRAFQVNDYPRDRRVLAEQAYPNAIHSPAIDGLVVQITAWQCIRKIQDEAVGAGGHLTTHRNRLTGRDFNLDPITAICNCYAADLRPRLDRCRDEHRPAKHERE